jgi:2,3-bisphosphoglycerate-dependent phosphoglycerate mutase
MAKMILIRHGQSEWNAKGLWTGWTDVALTDQGLAEARAAGEVLKETGIKFDEAFNSCLWRSWQTLHEITTVLGMAVTLPVCGSPALNERDYGDLTAKNKWQVRDEYGEEKFNLWRRGWDYPVPGGETLKDVYARAVPYYESVILPKLKADKNVIVSSSGNTLRALVKYLDGVADTDVAGLEIGTGEVLVYDIDATGKVVSKEQKTVGGAA